MSAKLNQALMKDFVRRSQALGYKGKKRDDAAIDFLAGALSALDAVKTIRFAGETENFDKLAQHLGAVAAMLIAPRGYAEVERIAEGVEA